MEARAISQTLSVTVVIVIILAAFAGYGAGYFTRAPQVIMTTTVSTSTSTIFVTRTMTTNTSSTTSCSATGGIGCPHFLNETFVISINYTGPWGLSYQGYLGSDMSLVESGNFFGHGLTSESITLSGTDTVGITACVEAQKLDASSSAIIVTLGSSADSNQTSLPYGTAKVCLAYEVV